MKTKAALFGFGFASLAALAAAVSYQQGLWPQATANLESSVGGASLERAPVPVVDSSYDLSAHQTLSRVILLIRENYVDPTRVDPYEMFTKALSEIEQTVPEVIIDPTGSGGRVDVTVGAVSQTFELGSLDQLWEVTMALRDIFRFLQLHIKDADVRRNIEYAAVNGMLATLDPHSILLRPESFNEVKLSTKGEFGGLGIVISIRDGKLTVISPIVGTPASRAGLHAKDTIMRIGQESSVNMTLEDAVSRLRGKPGTKVTIWVLRKGWTEAREFTLTRAIIKIESVTSKLLDEGVGYVRIKSFQNNTSKDLDDHLQALRREFGGELKGLVLDLRNNPGGLLDQAILVSDTFIDRGPLVITVGEGNRKRDVKAAHFSGTESDYPIAVLVNGGSASASEIVSGALRNHDRGIVLGQRTFGKGSVQVLYDFKDRSALKLTIAQYLTPGDISIQSVGISPDVEIVPASVTKERVYLALSDIGTREADLDHHLNQHGTTSRPTGEKPSHRVTRFIPGEDEEVSCQDRTQCPGERICKGGVCVDPGPDDETGYDEFKYDFEVKLAHDVLTTAGAGSRQQILQRSKKLFAEREASQDALVTNRLKGLGVDWTPGSGGDGNGVVDVSLVSKGERSVEIKAGSEITFTATVTNRSKLALHRVIGVSKSENPFFRQMQFPFGRLEPGKSRTWDVKIKLPDDLTDRADLVSLNMYAGTDELQGKSEAMVRVQALARPTFAYTYQIDDVAHGNGDGTLQVGEKVALRVNVQNTGPGLAADAMASIKNVTGPEVYLDRGRSSIGEIKVGKSASATMTFEVRKSIPVVKLKMSIWDSTLGTSLSDAIEVPVLPATPVKKDKRGLKVARNKTVNIYSYASPDAAVLGQLDGGVAAQSDAAVAGGKWRRVRSADGLLGFVRTGDVKLVRSPKKAGSHEHWPGTGQSAPRVDVNLADYVLDADTLALSGSIRDSSPPLDMFIFVNDKKVYFESYAEHKDGAFAQPFAAKVPLKEGVNAIALVVRENDELVTRRVFGVYRVGDGQKALAADFSKRKR